MRAYAVIDRQGQVVEVCGGRLAIYPKDDAALDVVRFEAKADKGYCVAEVIVVVHRIYIGEHDEAEEVSHE